MSYPHSLGNLLPQPGSTTLSSENVSSSFKTIHPDSPRTLYPGELHLRGWPLPNSTSPQRAPMHLDDGTLSKYYIL